MGKKTKFQLHGTGRVKVNVDGKIVIAQPEEIVEVDTKDESYSYFFESRRWEEISEEKYEKTLGEKKLEDIKEDLADDGKRNYSHDPNRKSPGRKKKKKEDE